MVQQNDLRIKLNKEASILLDICETSKFRLLSSTDLLGILCKSSDFSRHAHILSRKINLIFYVKDCFANNLSEDAQ